MGGDDTSLPQCAKQELKVRLLEETLGGTFWVTAVGDDDIKLSLPVLEELEAIADVGLDSRVLEPNRHAWEVLLAQSDDSLVNVAQDGLLDTLVLDHLPQNTTITSTNHKNLLRVGV